jgi:hypothetical protein
LRAVRLELVTAEPSLQLEYYVDDAVGDGNGAPSMGERCRVMVRLKNEGYDVEGAVAQISSWRGDLVCSLRFEATLCEDGSVEFRYRDLVGTAADGRGATIGLESPSGCGGYLYACNWAASGSSGLWVVYRPPWIAGDADNDRLPDEYEWFWFGTLNRVGIQDTDRDGCPNYAEFRAGTNPLDPD